MESNPGNPAPDLTTLWLMILTVYGTIIVIIGLLCFLLWLVTWSRKRRKSSSSDLEPTRTNADEWFSPEGQKELYRDFSPN